MAQLVRELASVENGAAGRVAFSSVREEALSFRWQARRYQAVAKLADALAKFGGGSLLTATLLLIVGGQTRAVIVVTAALTLLLFVVGTIVWVYGDLKVARWEYQAEWLEAALKEVER